VENIISDIKDRRLDTTYVALMLDIFSNKGLGYAGKDSQEVGPSRIVRREVVKTFMKAFNKNIMVVEVALQKVKKQDLAIMDPLGILLHDRPTFVTWIEVAIGYSAQQLVHAGGHFAEIVAEFRDGDQVIDIYPPTHCFNKTANIDEEQISAGAPTDDVAHHLFTKIGQFEATEAPIKPGLEENTETSSAPPNGLDTPTINEIDTTSIILPSDRDGTSDIVFVQDSSASKPDSISVPKKSTQISKPIKPKPTSKPIARPTFSPTEHPLKGPRDITFSDLLQ
jgi:hypothetical protein